MDAKLSLIGLKQIDDALAGFPAEFSHRILQAAHAEAAKILVSKEHLLAPVGRTGKLADSIGIIKTPFARAAVIGEVQVGPRRGRFGGSHAHLVEFGTKKRYFNGANRGSMPKHPFVEPAFDQTQDQVIGSISVALSQKAYSYLTRKLKNG